MFTLISLVIIITFGLLLNSVKFIMLFIPRGVPLIILPLLFPIELISYSSRVISLAVRLFANMMSGHTLLKILIGFS
jgi:F-type H+-transporting ATPase subunit a